VAEKDNEAKIKITAVDETKEAIKSAKEGFEKLKEHGEKLNGMLGMLLPAIAGTEFTEIIMGSAEAADKMGKLARTSGMTVESFNGLSYAARLSDVDTQTFSKSMEKLSNYMGMAQIKGGQQAAMLQALGITAKDPEHAMYQLADAMKNIEDPAQRVYVAQQLLGKGGAAMIPALMEGGDALHKLADEGRALNPVTAEFARQSEAMNDNLSRLKAEGEGTATVLAEGIVPAVNDLLQEFMDLGGSGHEVAQVIGEGIGNALRGVAIAGGAAVLVFREVGNAELFMLQASADLLSGDIEGLKDTMAERAQTAKDALNDYDKFRDKVLGVGAASEEMGEKGKKAVTDLSHAVGVGNTQMDGIIARIKQSTEQMGLASESASKLTETQKMRSQVDKLVASGMLTLNAAEQKHIDLLLAQMGAAEKLKQHHDADIAARKEAQKLADQAASQTRTSIDQMEFEKTLYGKSAEEVRRLTDEHNADLKARTAIAALMTNDKLKDHPEEIQKVTDAIMRQVAAEKALAVSKERQDFNKKLDAQDPAKTEMARYKEQLKMLDAYHERKSITDQAYAAQEYEAALSHQSTMISLFEQGKLSEEQLDKLGWDLKLRGELDMMQKLVSAGAEHSRALFNINKAAKLAQAAITLPSTVMDAFAVGTSQGGPWLGAAYAAVAFAAQSAQIEAIASAQFGGGMAGAAPSAGGSVSGTALPGQAANPNIIAAAPPQTMPAGQAAAPARQVNITLSGTDFYSAAAVRDQLIPALNDALGDGVIINVNQG